MLKGLGDAFDAAAGAARRRRLQRALAAGEDEHLPLRKRTCVACGSRAPDCYFVGCAHQVGLPAVPLRTCQGVRFLECDQCWGMFSGHLQGVSYSAAASGASGVGAFGRGATRVHGRPLRLHDGRLRKTFMPAGGTRERNRSCGHRRAFNPCRSLVPSLPSRRGGGYTRVWYLIRKKVELVNPHRVKHFFSEEEVCLYSSGRATGLMSGKQRVINRLISLARGLRLLRSVAV
jgi:hypothetical protein